MVKYKVMLTNSFQTRCQKFQSTRKMLLPGISRELHGTQPSISSRLCWIWLLVASGIVSCSNFGTRYYQMAWFYISLFSIRPRVSTHWSDGSSKNSWFTGNVFNMFLHFESVIHMLHRLHTDNDCTCTGAKVPETAVKFAHGSCEYLCTISACETQYVQ